ncbi:MAG: formylglycine-generating enzyme family protein [Thermoanaerobaculum sp.]|nr:formylglycine-generating enzyme family protein [Thermoanaerobaculum sp.]
MSAPFALALVLLELETVTPAQDMVLVSIPQAWVGCSPQDNRCLADEKPGAWVGLRPFWLDTQEVTLGAFRAFATATGRAVPTQPPTSGDRAPVVNVSHRDAEAFCRWLGKRLPSEAEWEAAARGGDPEAIYPTGGTISHDSANFSGVAGRDRFPGLAPVGSFAPNPLGIFDLAGNVWEWVADSYTPTPPRQQQANPDGKLKVTKGGAWNTGPLSLRVSNRGRLPENAVSDGVGFRCARDSQEGEVPSPAAAPLPAGAGVVPAPGDAGLTPSPTPAGPRKEPLPLPPVLQSALVEPLQERIVGPAQVALIRLPGGSFQRGCVKGDSLCSADEQPRREITLTPFWMAKTEVTVAQFRAFVEASGTLMPDQPTWSGEHFPVVNVTWEEAQAFCRWLGGRLPTEAEWEYAARGGAAGMRYPGGHEITHDEANFDGVEGRDQFTKAAPVGSFPPNGFGLLDMLGNVWEWCWDWYRDDYYASSPPQDPMGPQEGSQKVVRGGSFTSDPGRLRLSYRSSLKPDERWVFTGFRCVIPGSGEGFTAPASRRP